MHIQLMEMKWWILQERTVFKTDCKQVPIGDVSKIEIPRTLMPRLH